MLIQRGKAAILNIARGAAFHLFEASPSFGERLP
jgi:hypothetical protein